MKEITLIGRKVPESKLLQTTSNKTAGKSQHLECIPDVAIEAGCNQNVELITTITVNIEIKRQEQFAKQRQVLRKK